MLLRSIPALLLAASTANAFHDAHPFLMLSSESLNKDLQTQQLSTAQNVEESVLSHLSPCDRSRYVIFTQPGLKVEDFQHMPKLRERMGEQEAGRWMQIPEVIGGGLDTERLAEQLDTMCGLRESGSQHLVMRPLPPLTWGVEHRALQIRATDDSIARNLAELTKSGETYIVVYAGTPSLDRQKTVEPAHQDLPYQMDEPYPSALHTDLKRDVSTRSAANNTQSRLPLFEKYQFLSPPLFMGLTVFLLLFIILYVGVTAIAGLEVSYAAFQKEMGPQAQNKGKQQ